MKEEISFEKAFEKLDKILQTLNEKKVSLEDSLKMFEEANYLIKECNKKIQDAEQKIEILIKDRKDDLEIENDIPKTKNFEPLNQKVLDN